MPTNSIRVKIEVPEGTSDEARGAAERQAHEAAVLALWQEGQLTIRQAAAELGLTYYDFLDILAERGIPVERSEVSLAKIEEASRKLADRRQQ